MMKMLLYSFGSYSPDTSYDIQIYPAKKVDDNVFTVVCGKES